MDHHERFRVAMEANPDLRNELDQEIETYADTRPEVNSHNAASYIRRKWNRVTEFQALFPHDPVNGMLGVAVYHKLHICDGRRLENKSIGGSDVKVYCE